MTKKEVKQNRRRKKLFLAILMILFTGVLLTTSTYAWFTANKTVTVNQIDVTVAATNGLQISVDAATWKPTITNDDIIKAASATSYTAAVNQIPSGDSSPVSTIGAVDTNTGYLQMYSGAIESDGANYILTAARETETAGTEGKFVAFDLFFKTTEDTAIYLTNASNVLYSSGPKGLENAARVAFVVEGTVDAGAAAADAQKLKAGSDVIIWEPNADVHTPTGVANAINTYGLTATQTSPTNLGYYGVKAPIQASYKVALDSKDTNYFASVTPDIITPAAYDEETSFKKAFDLKAGITKIRFYMWIEGQDVDCENDASGGSISYNLQFSMNASA